jgi:hypothetical protein
VVEGRVDGFRRAVVGIWRRKRAAEAVDAKVASVATENCILNMSSRVVLVMLSVAGNQPYGSRLASSSAKRNPGLGSSVAPSSSAPTINYFHMCLLRLDCALIF